MSTIVITAMTTVDIRAEPSRPCFLAPTSEKRRINVQIPPIPTDTSVIGTTRLGIRSEIKAVAPKLMAASKGIVNEYCISISPGKYIRTDYAVGLQLR